MGNSAAAGAVSSSAMVSPMSGGGAPVVHGCMQPSASFCMRVSTYVLMILCIEADFCMHRDTLCSHTVYFVDNNCCTAPRKLPPTQHHVRILGAAVESYVHEMMC